MPNSNLTKRVAAEIRAEMARQTKTTADVAQETGLSQRTTHRLVKGEREITIGELEAVCRALGVQISQILRAGNPAAA